VLGHAQLTLECSTAAYSGTGLLCCLPPPPSALSPCRAAGRRVKPSALSTSRDCGQRMPYFAANIKSISHATFSLVSVSGGRHPKRKEDSW
jgi:hypothetical protein